MRYLGALLLVMAYSAPAQIVGSEAALSLTTKSPTNQVVYCISKKLDDRGARFNSLKAPDGSEARITVSAPRPPLAIVHIEETIAVYVVSNGKLNLHFNSAIFGNYKNGYKNIAADCT